MEILLWILLGIAGGFALAKGVLAFKRRSSEAGAAGVIDTTGFAQALFENSPQGILVADESLRIERVNEAYCRMSGRSQQELIGLRPPFPGWAPEQSTKIRRFIQQTMDGVLRPIELSYLRPDGTRVQVEFSPGRFRTRDGRTHFFGVVNDLTERKRQEEELKESEERFRRIAETSTDVIHQIDTDGIVVYCSPSVEKVLGYTAEEFAGKSFRAHFVPEDLPAADDLFVRNFRGEEIRNAELRILNKHGIPVFIEINATPIRKEGRIIGSQGIARDITARKAIEESLRASEARLRTVIENVPFDFFFIDETGRYAMQNTTITRRWGGDLIGKRPEDLAPGEETLAVWLNNNRRAFAGEVVEGEVSFRFGDEERQFYNVISPVREGDKIRGILGVNIDITERKRAEAALRESEEKYRFLVENTGTAVTFWDMEGRLVFINRIAARYLGRAPEDLVGASLQDLAPEKLAGEAFAAIREALDSGAGVQGESEVALPSGKRWFRSYLQPVRGAEGKLLGVQVVSHDITELTQVERSLRERDARLRLLVAQVPAIVWTVDRELRFTSSAGAGLKALGLAPGQVVGMTLFEFFQLRDPEYLPIAMHRKSLEGEATTYEMTWNGSVWETHTEPLRAESGEIIGCLAIGLDVTQRKRAEEESKRTGEELRALAGRLQAVREEESANIAREIHDELGQALSGFKFGLSFIHRRLSCCQKHEERAELEEKIVEMNEQLDATIDEVRRISTQLRPKILDDLGLVGAIEWQAQEFQQRANVVCSVNAYGVASDLDLDPPRTTAVFRIFQEILTNIRRHAGATRVFVDLRREGGAFLLEVRDNGRGIRRDRLPRLEGLGILGMRERAQVFGGHVAIESVEGKGTSVKVTIPVSGPS